MATAAEEREGTGCLGRADANEPVFVLRGQDQTAPMLVRAWAAMVELHAPGQRNASKMLRKAKEARSLADRMEQWHTRKLPD